MASRHSTYEATLLSTNSVNRSFVDQAPCYEEVKIIDPNKGYTVRNYTGYRDYPDNINVAYLKKTGVADRLSITNDNIFRGTTDFSLLRNNLVLERKFDSSDRIVSKANYTHKILLLDSASGTYIEPYNYAGPINNTITKHYHYKIYDFFHRIDSIKNTLYSYTDNMVDSLESSTSFSYSSQYPYLMISQVSQGADDEKLKNIITYPFSSTLYNFSSEMLTKNMVNYPIESIYYKDDDVTGGVLFEYGKSNNILFNNKVYGLSIDQSIPSNLFTHSTSGSKDERYRLEMQTSIIDQYGNPVETRGTGGQVVTNLWGHKGQYPIAKISNATYDDVIAALGVNASSVLTQFDQSDVSESYIQDHIDVIRQNLPEALVETYTYKPYIGLTSKTDVRGVIEYYEYDIFNRLSTIRNKDGNLLQSFCYNYTNQLMDCEGNVFPTTTYPLVYVKMEKIYTHEILLDGDGDQELHELRGDIIVRFYENSTGTVPYHVSDPDFIVSLFVDSRSDIYPPISRPFTKLGMGTSTILLSNVPIGEQFSQRNFDTNQFEVINTTNYQFYLLSDDKYSIISN